MVKYPEDWKVVPLGRLCSKIGSGATPTGGSASYCDVGVSLIRSQNVLDNCFSENGLAHINDEQAAQLDNVAIESHDVLLNITGDSVARVCVVDDAVLPARVNQHVCILRTKPCECDYNYVCYKLVHDKDRLLTIAAAGGTRNALTKKNVEQFELNIPPLPEQKRIAAVLGNVDKLIDNLSRRIEKKRLVKQGVMQDLLSVGPAALTQRAQSSQRNAKTLRSSVDSAFFASAPAGNLVPRRRLPGFKGEWKRVKIGNLLTLGHGRDYKGLPEGDVPVYGTGGVMCKVDGYLYDGPTVCIGRKGTIDEPIYHEGKIWTVDTLFYTHSFKDVFPRFVYYKFLLVDWLGYNSASGVPSLTSNTIEAIELLMPPTLPEQKAIAGVLGAMDGELAKLEAKLAKYRSLKQGLMNDLLTGKVRV